MIQVEFLYFDGCPHQEQAWNNLQAIIGEGRFEVNVERRKVESAEDAKKWRFLGSPSIRINGIDLERRTGSEDDYALQCRVYHNPGGFAGAPTKRMIEMALLKAKQQP